MNKEQQMKALKSEIKQTFSKLNSRKDGQFHLEELRNEVMSLVGNTVIVNHGTHSTANHDLNEVDDLMQVLNDEHRSFLDRMELKEKEGKDQ